MAGKRRRAAEEAAAPPTAAAAANAPGPALESLLESQQRQAAPAAPAAAGVLSTDMVATAPPDGRDRRAEMADIARRRAAHFATFNDDAADSSNNIHVGGNEARTLGPWSSAMELINQRQQAQEQRQAKLRDHDGLPGADGGADGVPTAWLPRRDPGLGPRRACPVKPLEALCCRLLVDYLDCIESLAGVPDIIRTQLAVAAAKERKLTPQAALLFAEGATSELVLPDCKELDKAAMAQVLQQVATHRLERLELSFCGRGLGDCTLGKALPPAPPLAAAQPGGALGAGRSGRGGPAATPASHATSLPLLERQDMLMPPPQARGAAAAGDASEAFVRAVRALPVAPLEGGGSRDAPGAGQHGEQGGPCLQLPRLQSLKLGGAYRLNDGGLYLMLSVAPGLHTLAVPDASRLSSGILPHMPFLCPHLKHLDLTNCRGLGGAALAASLAALPHLQEVTLDGIPEVDDGVLAALAVSPPELRCLSLMLCTGVSDHGLTALAAGRPHLRALRVDGCAKVTDTGVLAVAGGCRELQLLGARRLPKVGDASLAQVAAGGSLRHLVLHGNADVTDRSLAALAKHCAQTLTMLDVSFCRSITSDGLGNLVDCCTGLTRLLVFGCSQLGNKFAHGHGNDTLAQVGLHGLGTAVTAGSM